MAGTPDDAKIIYTGPSPRGWHRLQQAAECLQKYAWTYEKPKVEGEGEQKSPALVKGTLIHLALAQHYVRMRARQQGENQDEWAEPYEAVELIAKLEGAEAYVENIIETYEAYAACYEDDEHTWEIMGVEELNQTMIKGKYLLTGRLDLSVRDKGGRIFGIDHKSSSRITANHAKFYGISGQLLGYSHMTKEKFGDNYGGFIVNLIQHGPKHRFQRIPLSRSPNLEARFEQIVVDIEESIERMQATGRHYADWPKAINEMTCYGRYGPCPFMEQCKRGEGSKVGGDWTFSL